MTNQQCNLIDDYIADEMPAEQRRSFESHLMDCDACRVSIDEWNVMRSTLKRSVERLNRPSESLLARIEIVATQMHAVPRERNPRLAIVAAICVLIAPALMMLAMNGFDTQRDRKDVVVTREEDAVAIEPNVTVTFSDDVIGLPIDIGDPDVTVVWIYPVSKNEHETN